MLAIVLVCAVIGLATIIPVLLVVGTIPRRPY